MFLGDTMKNICAIVATLALAAGCGKVAEAPTANDGTTIYLIKVVPPCAKGSIEFVGVDQGYPAIKCKQESTGKELVCSTWQSGFEKTNYVKVRCFYIQQ